jgi:hypothetical protein
MKPGRSIILCISGRHHQARQLSKVRRQASTETATSPPIDLNMSVRPGLGA